MCVICCAEGENAKREKGRTDLDDDGGGSVHDDPGGAFYGGPDVLVQEGGVSGVGSNMVCVGHFDGEIVEHVGPVLALLHGGRKDDIDGGGEGYQKGGNASDLEDVVCACEGPVILRCEDEMEQENGSESESDTDEKDLDGE